MGVLKDEGCVEGEGYGFDLLAEVMIEEELF
jgi:hypothetical protein